MTFPSVTVGGAPFERGRQYGEQARAGVHATIQAYEEVFQHFAGFDWTRSRTEAERYVPAIDAFDPAYIEEMRGIAVGAGVDFGDVLTVNVRTEILYAARVRNASLLPPPAECSVFAHVGGGGVVAGQNWDWMPFATETVVVLRADPVDSPAFMTVVEAGLLAKFGVNAAGLAILTNALACGDDVGAVGIPYHVMLRALLGCSTTAEAVDRVESAARASSANFLVVDSSGTAVDVEGRPGGASRAHRLRPDADGFLLHTNHFCANGFDSVDLADLVPSTSRTRLCRLAELVKAGHSNHAWTLGAEMLADHGNEPDSICRHPDLAVHPMEQTKTVASVLLDLGAQRLAVAAGPPCSFSYDPVQHPT